MAHSYVDFESRFVRLSDRVIEVLRHFLAGVSDEIGHGGWPADSAPDLRAFVAGRKKSAPD